MNRHFQDTKYYLKRAGQSVWAGVGAEFRPLRKRFDGLVDREEEEVPERGRFDAVQESLERVRDRVDGYRRDRPSA